MHNRTDDLTISDQDLLLRRILDQPAIWFKIAEDGSIRPSSAAFKDSYTNEVSVHVQSLTTEEAVLAQGKPGDGLVSIPARVPRSLNHIVAATVEADDPEDPSHRVICAPAELGKGARTRAARVMASEAVWIVFPESFNPTKT